MTHRLEIVIRACCHSGLGMRHLVMAALAPLILHTFSVGASPSFDIVDTWLHHSGHHARRRGLGDFRFPIPLSLRNSSFHHPHHAIRLAGGGLDYSKWDDFSDDDPDEELPPHEIDRFDLAQKKHERHRDTLKALMEDAEKAVRENPTELTDDVITEVENDDDSTWLSVLGAMYYSSGMEDKAERVWQRATEVKDPIPGAMLLYARYLACKKSDFAAAEALVARARLHHPSDEEALKAEGELERLVEDIEGEGEAAKEARVSAAVASALTSFEKSIQAVMEGSAALGGTSKGAVSSESTVPKAAPPPAAPAKRKRERASGPEEDRVDRKEIEAVLERADRLFDDEKSLLDPQMQDMQKMLASAENELEGSGGSLDPNVQELRGELAKMSLGFDKEVGGLSEEQVKMMKELVGGAGGEGAAHGEPGSVLDRFKTRDETKK